MNIIGSKWVFKNKLDEAGVITRNKARLVAKGYNQDYGDYFGVWCFVIWFDCLVDYPVVSGNWM